MFSRSFWYNANFAPDKPGIINFLVWYTKTLFSVAILFIIVVLINPFDNKLILSNLLILILPFFEEHGRIVYSTNSRNRTYYSIQFGLFLFIIEIITESMNGFHIELETIFITLSNQYLSLFTHIMLSLFIIILYNLKDKSVIKSLWAVWIIASIFHIVLNFSMDFAATGSIFIE